MTDLGESFDLNPLCLVKLKILECLEHLTSPEVVFGAAEGLFKLLGRRRPNSELLKHCNRILVVQPDLIGDVVLTSPLLRELRSLYPESWITLVVEPQVLNLMEHCPYLNEVLTYDCKKWRSKEHWTYFLSAVGLSCRHLIWRKFDIAIFPHWDCDRYYGTMAAYLSGAIYRISYSETVNREKRVANRNYDLLLTHALEESEVRHEVRQKLCILRTFNYVPTSEALEVWLTQDDEAFASQFLQSHRQRVGAPLIAMCTGASFPSKMWPIDRFLQVAWWLVTTHDAEILLVGGPSDRQDGEQLKSRLGHRLINSAGLTTIRQAAALLKRCQLYVGNDTGPMHLAAAVGLPVVAISCHPLDAASQKPYSPKRFGPWGVRHRVLQPPVALDRCATSGKADDGSDFPDVCIAVRPHCILGVGADDVKEAIAEVFHVTKDCRPAE
jgi:heptosyltransferase-2